MLDHLLCSRAMLPHDRGAGIHSEVLPDEGVAFASDIKCPEADHAPVIATFDVGIEHGGVRCRFRLNRSSLLRRAARLGPSGGETDRPDPA